MSNGVDRDLGAFEARLDAYEAQLTEVRTDVKKLLDYAARTKGGWFAIATAGTLGAGMFAGFMKLVSMVKGGG